MVEAIDTADVQTLGALEGFFDIVRVPRRDELVLHTLNDNRRRLDTWERFREPLQFVFQGVDFFVTVHPIFREPSFDGREFSRVVVPLPLLNFRVHGRSDQHESFNELWIIGRHSHNHWPTE